MTIIKKFEPDLQKRKYPKKYFILGSLFLFALTILQIWASNTVVTYGDKFSKLSMLSRSLEMENQILQNEIAKNSSLYYVASKSAQLGFSKSESIQYIH